METVIRKPHIIIFEDEKDKKKEKDDEEEEEEDTDYYKLNPVEAKLTRISLHLNTLDLSDDKKTELDGAIDLLRSNPKQFLDTFHKSQETGQKKYSPNDNNKESSIEDLDFPDIQKELLDIANSIKEMTIPNIPKIPPRHSLKNNSLYTVKEELEYEGRYKPSASKIPQTKIIPPPFLTKVCSKNDEEDEEIDLSDYYEKPGEEKFPHKPPKLPPPSPTLPKRSLEMLPLKEEYYEKPEKFPHKLPKIPPPISTLPRRSPEILPVNEEYYEKPGTHSSSLPPQYTEHVKGFSTTSSARPNQHTGESVINIPKRVEEQQPRRVNKSNSCCICFSYLVLLVGALNVLLYIYIFLLSQRIISITTTY